LVSVNVEKVRKLFWL